MAFSEANYYREFKRVRNRLRRHAPVDIVLRAIRYANGGENKLENCRRAPWLMMLMIKWVLTDENFGHRGRPNATNQQTDRLFQEAYELSRWTRMPNEYENLHLFMRSVAHQQFMFQKDFSYADFARQFVLFADLDDGHRLSRAFADAYGLEIEQFLTLTLGLVGKYLRGNFEPVRQHWFSTLAIPDAARIVPVFFSALSATPEQMREFLLENGTRQRAADEYVEQTPLTAKPFLQVGEEYWPVHVAVLFRALEHYVYDQLRAIDPEWFMQSFGKIFERYVHDVLAPIHARIYVEDELKRLRTTPGKVVDFLVDEEGANIFIDAKGVAGTHEAMVTHASRTLRNRTKAAALKAVVQANELLGAMVAGEMAEGGPPLKDRNILLVVTYKDLHLGNGTTFEKAVAPADIAEIYQGRSAASSIPLDNIYFMAIDSFEALCGAVMHGELTFSDAIAQAQAADSDAATKKFDFRQHLQEMQVVQRIPAAVRDRIEEAMNSLAEGLGADVS